MRAAALILLAACPSFALAATPIDAVLKDFNRRHPSPAAAAVSKAAAALEAGRPSAARQALGPARPDRDFSDYVDWITAESWIQEGRAQLRSGQLGTAASSFREALKALARIEPAQAYSPFIPSIGQELAKTELLLGSALARQKQDPTAQRELESGFQRLALASALSWVEPMNAQDYAASCARRDTPQCALWIRRLQTAFPRQSAEHKALAAYVFPKSSPSPSPTAAAEASSETLIAVGARGTQAYKAPDLDQAAIDDALSLAISGDHRKAIPALEKFLEDFPRSGHRFRARFWLARLQKSKGEAEESRKNFETLLVEAPLGFHGLLASYELGRSARELISGELPGGTDRETTLTPMESFRIRRAEKFLAAGAESLAALELKEIRGRDSFSSEFLVYLAWLHAASRSHLGSFRVLQTLIDRGSSFARTSFVLRMIFPTGEFERIKKAADDAGVDPVLVLSLIKQESAFETQATSSSGASGLMQLMPATAVDTDPAVALRDLKTPDANLRVGIRYLKQMLTKYDGSIALALAAYNAGPGNADKWVKQFGTDQGLLAFVERIPFKETREYVTSIIRNYAWYSPLLPGGDPMKPLEAFWKDPQWKTKAASAPTPAATPGPTASSTPTPSPSPAVTAAGT